MYNTRMMVFNILYTLSRGCRCLLSFLLLLFPTPFNPLHPRTRFGNRFESITYLNPRSSDVLTRPRLPRRGFTGKYYERMSFFMIYACGWRFCLQFFIYVYIDTFIMDGSILCIIGITCIYIWYLFFILNRDS